MRRSLPKRPYGLPEARPLTWPTKPPGTIHEVYLRPGELHFADERTRIRTLLGSCVAFTLWHERLRLGGMCHYMLPSRPVERIGGLDGRYGDEALELLLAEARRAGAAPTECQVKVFGGGNMTGESAARPDVARRNVEAARVLARRHGLTIRTEHLGGSGHRHVVLDVMSGDVWLRHEPLGPGGLG